MDEAERLARFEEFKRTCEDNPGIIDAVIDSIIEKCLLEGREFYVFSNWEELLDWDPPKRTLTSTRGSDIRMEPRRARLGNVWIYDPQWLTLTYPPAYYEINLETCFSNAKILNWICQIWKKSWCTAEVIADFIEQINVLIDPQATICSSGRECGPLDVKKLLHKRKA